MRFKRVKRKKSFEYIRLSLLQPTARTSSTDEGNQSANDESDGPAIYPPIIICKAHDDSDLKRSISKIERRLEREVANFPGLDVFQIDAKEIADSERAAAIDIGNINEVVARFSR